MQVNMFQESSPSELSQGDEPVQKRTRMLLSCTPCRNSKLKCDRQQPCSHCGKKARVDRCVYEPRSARKKPQAKNMTARLKHLEGLVREMMENEGKTAKPREERSDANSVPLLQGHVVQEEHGTTYVGATHCMAILEDIEDLKMYFDDSEEQKEGASPTDELDAPEMLLSPRTIPSNRDALIAQLPERHIADRLIMRYFSSMSASQHIVHRPTFTRMYARFWQDPNDTSLHWLSQLFMMLALGIFFNKFAAPHELTADSPVPVFDRIKNYRSCAGWALIWGKYTQPTAATLPAFLLYVVSHFIFGHAAQMNCYVLSGVCIRLLLKMGLHRDPSKLANISPYEGEMRRRIWNLAMQIELLASFHMGLPSMLQGIETDTKVPSNLLDDDFDEDSTSLPPERPSTDYTHIAFSINITKLLRVFGQIALQAHSLSPPEYDDVLKLDAILQEIGGNVPAFMHVRPLDDCVGDSPALITERFRLAAIYNKCRCVLHRRYLAEPIPHKEHNYSRKECIEGALALLEYQHIIWKASKPGNVLASTSWFVSSLAVHDFLLAAMIIYLVIQNEGYPDEEAGFGFEGTKPSKEELKGMLKRSHFIWIDVAESMVELRKTADTLAAMLANLGDPVDRHADVSEGLGFMLTQSSEYQSSWSESHLLPTLGLEGQNSSSRLIPFSIPQPTSNPTSMDYSAVDPQGNILPTNIDFDAPWISRYHGVAIPRHVPSCYDPTSYEPRKGMYHGISHRPIDQSRRDHSCIIPLMDHNRDSS